MVKYQLHLTIDQKWVNYFNKNPSSNWKFCFARKSQSVGSDTTFNVISYSDVISNNITVEWEDIYMMAGGKKAFSAGAMITVTTSAKSIEYGEGFFLYSWATTEVKKVASAPKNGFLFHNIPEAAAILYQAINGVPTPVYITPEDSLPPNTTEVLKPKVEVAVWFQRAVETGTMVDEALTDAYTISMATQSVTGGYDANGSWFIKESPILYGFAVDIAALEMASGSLNLNGDKSGSADGDIVPAPPTAGRTFLGNITFDDYVSPAQRTTIVNDITAGLPQYKATPRFSVTNHQNKSESIVFDFSASDTPNTALQHARGAWNDAFDGLNAAVKPLCTNAGAVVNKQ